MTWKWAEKLFCCSKGKENTLVHSEISRAVTEAAKASSSQSTRKNNASNESNDEHCEFIEPTNRAKYLDIIVNDLAFHIKLKTQTEELHDIYGSVEETVSYLLNKVGNLEPVLKSSEIVRTGSCYDGTKILEPDEFDFLAVIDCLSLTTTATVLATEKCATGGFAHAAFTDPSSRSPIIDSNSNNCVVACRHMNSLREIFREHFHSVIQKQISETFSLRKPTGTLMLKGFAVSVNGPQCSVSVLWKSNTDKTKPLVINIDISPAIKCSGIGKILNSCDVINEAVFELMLHDNFFYLIPRPHPLCNKCFKLVFAQSDQRLVKELSDSHTKTFTVLKYLAHDVLKFNFRLKKIFNSFALKMAVFHHSFNCNEFQPQNASECLMSTLAYIKDQLNQEPPVMTSIFTVSRNVWKNLNLTEEELSLARDIINNTIEVFENIRCENFRTFSFDRLKDELLNACTGSISSVTHLKL